MLQKIINLPTPVHFVWGLSFSPKLTDHSVIPNSSFFTTIHDSFVLLIWAVPIVKCYLISISGDLGQTYNSLSTLEHSLQTGADTILFVGDLSYADRYQYHDVGVRWDSWGRFAERSAAYQPWIWSAGNHEIEYFPYMVKHDPGVKLILIFSRDTLDSLTYSCLHFLVKCFSS